MICECCGHDDGEDIIPPPVLSPEERREANIIRDFRKRTDPSYAAYCEVMEDMERSILFGANALREPLGQVFQGIGNIHPIEGWES